MPTPFLAALLVTYFLFVAAASPRVAQNMPADLAALAKKAGLTTPIVSWCRAEFRSGQKGAFAIASRAADGGGRYDALQADGTSIELSAFTGSPDLSCYSRAEAEDLNRTLKRSDTIHGHVTPRWNTTVVCGFVDNTTASCWQYAPADRAFVQVGRWVT